MPNWKTHFAISMIRTKKPFKELHCWIDNNKEERGVNHRSKNHYYSEELKEQVSKNFGGAEAVSEWLYHIALDNLDTSMINDWNYAKNNRNFLRFGFRGDGFIFYDEETLSDETLEDEFEDVYDYED